MNNIVLNVTANRLEIKKDTYSTGGSVNFDGCVFEFDSTWEGFIKTAVFGFGNSDFVRTEIQNNACVIPPICLQKEGILKIGVYGINDDGTVITTNAVAHRVDEGIGEENNWYEEDNLFVYNALKEIEGSLEEYKAGLDTRFNSLLKLLREQGSMSDVDVLPGEPDEWYTPSESVNTDDIPSATGNAKYQAYLDYILNVLVADFPEYVSIRKMSMDESGEFQLYAYTFEPQNYEKTVLVTACSHAEQDMTLLSLSYFLDELCRNFKSDRILSYLRSKVKLVVVPVANPYGFVNGSKYNFNGVDIQRNFPYKWNECKSENKGDSPIDQKEVNTLLNLLDSIFEDKLCAALDLNAGSNSTCGGMFFFPRFKDNCLSAVAEVVNRYNFEADDDESETKKIIASSVNPSFCNFLAEELKINTFSVLWSAYSYAGNTRIKKFTELIGNLLFALAKNSSYTVKKYKLPFVKHFSWRSSGEDDVYYLALNQEKVPVSSFELSVEKPCCICLTGYFLLNAPTACNVKLNPLLWQESSPEQTYEERLNMKEFSLEIPLTAGVHVIPVESVLQAYTTTYGASLSKIYPGKICFSLVAQSDDESVSVIGFSVTLKVFESDSGKVVEISRPMGGATDYVNHDDIPTQEIVYPAETVTERDAQYHD